MSAAVEQERQVEQLQQRLKDLHELYEAEQLQRTKVTEEKIGVDAELRQTLAALEQAKAKVAAKGRRAAELEDQIQQLRTGAGATQERVQWLELQVKEGERVSKGMKDERAAMEREIGLEQDHVGRLQQGLDEAEVRGASLEEELQRVRRRLMKAIEPVGEEEDEDMDGSRGTV